MSKCREKVPRGEAPAPRLKFVPETMLMTSRIYPGLIMLNAGSWARRKFNSAVSRGVSGAVRAGVDERVMP